MSEIPQENIGNAVGQEIRTGKQTAVGAGVLVATGVDVPQIDPEFQQEADELRYETDEERSEAEEIRNENIVLGGYDALFARDVRNQPIKMHINGVINRRQRYKDENLKLVAELMEEADTLEAQAKLVERRGRYIAEHPDFLESPDAEPVQTELREAGEAVSAAFDLLRET